MQRLIAADRGAAIDVHVLWHRASGTPGWFAAAVNSLHKQHVNYSVWVSESENISAARAEAFRYGSAPLVAYLDHDDVLMPGAAAAAEAVFSAKPGVVATYSWLEKIDAHGASLGVWERGGWDPAKQLADSREVLHWHVSRRVPTMKHLDAMASHPTGDGRILYGLLAGDGDLYCIKQPLMQFRIRDDERTGGSIYDEQFEANEAYCKQLIEPVLSRAAAAGRRQKW